MKKIMFPFILLFLLLSCDNQTTAVSEEEDKEVQLTELVGTKWYLKGIYYTDGTYKSVKETYSKDTISKAIMLYFFSDSSFFGTYCNEFGGGYILDGNKIEIEEGPTTFAMGCFSDFYDVVNSSFSFKATEKILKLDTKFEEYSGLEFQRAIEEPVEIDIVGTNWKLSELKENDGRIVQIEELLLDGEPKEKAFTLSFLESEKYEGFAGCHDFSGFYEAFGNMIGFIITKSEDKQCQFSRTYIELLTNLKSYSVTEGKLRIYPVHGYFHNYEYIEFDRIK